MARACLGEGLLQRQDQVNLEANLDHARKVRHSEHPSRVSSRDKPQCSKLAVLRFVKEEGNSEE